MEDIKALNKDLPDRIREWLRVEQAGETVKVTPCKYLEEDWQQVMDLYDQHGGRWEKIGGKDSHWLFNQPTNAPETEQPTKPVGKLTQTQLVQEGMALIEQGLAKVKEAYKRA